MSNRKSKERRALTLLRISEGPVLDEIQAERLKMFDAAGYIVDADEKTFKPRLKYSDVFGKVEK